jgi:hypothetical protein
MPKTEPVRFDRRVERPRLVSAATATLAISSAVSTTVAPGGLGTSFVDDERAPQQLFPVQVRNRLFGCTIVTDFYKGKAAGLACIAIMDDCDRVGVDSDIGEFSADIFFRGAEWEISYIEFFHR